MAQDTWELCPSSSVQPGYLEAVTPEPALLFPVSESYPYHYAQCFILKK